MTSHLLTPIPITKDNLNVVIDAGWITKDELCQGVDGRRRGRLPVASPHVVTTAPCVAARRGAGRISFREPSSIEA